MQVCLGISVKPTVDFPSDNVSNVKVVDQYFRGKTLLQILEYYC